MTLTSKQMRIVVDFAPENIPAKDGATPIKITPEYGEDLRLFAKGEFYYVAAHDDRSYNLADILMAIAATITGGGKHGMVEAAPAKPTTIQ